jgi:peptidoglycan/LPS O-acetylase OafA/YrhL
MLQSATPQSESAINGVYWTLTAEFWFYVLLPFVVAALHAAARRGHAALGRRALAVYAAALAITLAFRAAIQAADGAGLALPLEWATRQLPATLDVFAAGMLAAVASRLPGRIEAAARASGALVCAGLVGIVAMLYLMHHQHAAYWAGGPLFYLWHAVTAAFAGLLVIGASRSGRLARALFANRPAIHLGDLSYSLYLWHLPVALWVAAWVPPAAGELSYAAAATAAAVAASALSFRLVERPVLSRRGRIERWLGVGEGPAAR